MLKTSSLRELVRDHIPLEQGLRRLRFQRFQRSDGCQRPYSIRTRIKTTLAIIHLSWLTSETIFH